MDNPGDRRNFLVRAIYGLGALISAGLGMPAAAYLLIPGRSRGASDWIEVGAAEQFQKDMPEEVVFRRNRVDGWKVTSEKSTAWIIKLNGEELIALAPQCTHLGCAYSFDEKKGEFLCPCHTSNFSLQGKVLSGPAPRPLDRYSVKVEGGKVFLGSLDRPIKSA